MSSLVSPPYQPFDLVSCIYYFLVVSSSVSFSWQPSFRKVEANFHRLFLPSFSHSSIANFKHCWVIFPPFLPLFTLLELPSHALSSPISQTLLYRPTPLFSQAPAPCPSPLNSSFIYAPLVQKIPCYSVLA